MPQRFADLPRKLLHRRERPRRRQARACSGRASSRTSRCARAVAASSAIPILYAPVEIDGRDYVDGGIGDVAHIDVAEREGCRLIVVVNPMVPVHAGVDGSDVPTGHGKKRRVRDKGAIWVYNQAMRIWREARLQLGLEQFRKAHPDTDGDGARAQADRRHAVHVLADELRGAPRDPARGLHLRPCAG